MVTGVRGRLVTTSFARRVLPSLPGAAPAPAHIQRALDAWWERTEAALGPASSVRAIADAAVLPLLHLLGFAVVDRRDAGNRVCQIRTSAGGRPGPLFLVTSWSDSLDRTWQSAVRATIAADARWCFCCNGTALRVVDGQRTWSRDHLEFELAVLPGDLAAMSLFWSLCRAETMTGADRLLDRAVTLSSRHGVEVCQALGTGVLDALTALLAALRSACPSAPRDVMDHSLTIVYRVLFLLFAEARSLVPMWHPVYRSRYSLEAIVELLLAGRPSRGLWQAVQAISRLAHAGCSAGELKVTPFNGRLFSPSSSAALDRARIDDDTMARAVVALSSVQSGAGRERIVYQDLGVEQLGAVYERVLEYEPHLSTGGAALLRTRDVRQASGTFYTPRDITAYLIHQTLEPLVRGRSSEEILALRVLDPAMGSGAFLVGACRYLARAAEAALIEEGHWHPGDATGPERAMLRRRIAAQCLYGVDVNPMAVQLARLSLWLATLAADRPLSFLDHHLLAGDSLIGATPDDLARQPTKTGVNRRRAEPLPLFEHDSLTSVLGHAVDVRLALASEPDDSPSVVRSKDAALSVLQARDSPVGRWSRLLDLWCAGWFWPGRGAPDRTTFRDLGDRILRGRSTLPDATALPLLAQADGIAQQHRFLHWTIAFPEVFTGPDGAARNAPGFDAIVGNPPWDMIRGDSGDAPRRADRRQHAQMLTAFAREAGVYRVEARGHLNRYQLFLERALQLVRTEGRIGLVLPAGVIADAGTAPLRRHLFERASVDSLVGLDNRHGIFPIHRSVRFVLLAGTRGRPTDAVSCRFGVTRPDDLAAGATAPAHVVLSRHLLRRLSGDDDLGIPELTGVEDLKIVERISAEVPWLGSDAGWNVQFGRELNATDDKAALVPLTTSPRARPVVEGKLIEPFRVALQRCTLQLDPRHPAYTKLPSRARVAYRDVASASNRLTLIAAVLPANAVTTHTLSCARTPLAEDEQHVLCALLNSFVANYLIRMRVNTHVTVALVSRLPVPYVRRTDRTFARLATLATALAAANSPAEEQQEYAELQGIAARLYGLSRAHFAHVLTTFPLIRAEAKCAALNCFDTSNKEVPGPRRH